MAFDDGSAVLYRDDGRAIGTFTSAETALGLFSRCTDLRLVWIDPEVARDV